MEAELTDEIFEIILGKRNIDRANLPDFLNPKYDNQHDPFLLPDMDKAVKRLLRAHKGQEKITIYGDYDVDGVTSSALLLDAFEKFGFEKTTPGNDDLVATTNAPLAKTATHDSL